MIRHVLWLALLLSGCTAGRASVALLHAQQRVTRASEAGADEYAAYEVTMARAYLVKAREEASFSSYRESVELARDAADWADKAVIKMKEAGTGEGGTAPAPPPMTLQIGRPDADPAGEGAGAPEPTAPPADAPAQNGPTVTETPADGGPWGAPADAPPTGDAPPDDGSPAEEPAEEPDSEGPRKVIIVPRDPNDEEAP